MGVPSITKKQSFLFLFKIIFKKKGEKKTSIGFWIWIEGIVFSLAIIIMIFFGGFFFFFGRGCFGAMFDLIDKGKSKRKLNKMNYVSKWKG